MWGGGGGGRVKSNHTKIKNFSIYNSDLKVLEVLKNISPNYIAWETERKNDREKTIAH